MILFHGSNVEITTIDLSKSKKYKDFGQAFYLSAEKEQAQKMAEAKVVQFGGEEAISVFEIDESCLARDENQNYLHKYDVVYGPIADDYIGLQIRDYRRNNITFEQFLHNIKYHKGITYQYAFCTQKAVDLLVRL